ncbi:MAG: NAD(P)/FAD-dependent oxidoreductase [Pseudomonadales bacterium]|nr:NAD(P)/FAD-dependent oxidoreductase [Pseudomonadales bacterium]
MNTKRGYDSVIIGGGAAGLMCAAQLGQRGKRVLVLEKSPKVGRKILMSGGGRCNFTNQYTTPEDFISANPHFCKSALNRYTQWDFIGLVMEHEIAYHEKKLGQLFCDNSAKDILNMLLKECERAGVEIQTRCDIYDVNEAGLFQLNTSKGAFEAATLVVASGGLSIPSMGVTGFGYELAQQFGMNVLPTRAGLVPFTLTGELKNLSNTLSGVSVDAQVSNQQKAFRENILFTHRGLSGPAVLQISSYWNTGETVQVDLLPNDNAEAWLLQSKLNQSKSLLRTVVAEKLPKKLVLELERIWWPSLSETPLAQFSNNALIEIAQKLNGWQIKPSGTEGYRTAEVTLGGVDTDGLSSKTMESKTQSGLFFIGEVVDVTGHLGGFNFQWAWSSAFAAAESV